MTFDEYVEQITRLTERYKRKVETYEKKAKNVLARELKDLQTRYENDKENSK